MKLRTVFVGERKQVSVPEGWKIDSSVLIHPPKGKPKFAVLLRYDAPKEPGQLGFMSSRR